MKLSDAEWLVMGAVWDHPPSSVREVLERLERETGWAYTTVKTLLERLAAKGAVKAGRRGNAMLYAAAITRGAARRSALRALLDRAFDGAFGPLLQHMVAEERLGPKEREKLRRLLREAERELGPERDPGERA